MNDPRRMATALHSAGDMSVILDPDGYTGHGLLELAAARELVELAMEESGWPDRSKDEFGLTDHQRVLLVELREFEKSGAWST